MPVTALVTPGPEVTMQTPILLRRARIGIGRMHGRLLVADQNVLDLILLEQFVVNEKDGTARITEDVFDLFFLKTPDYNFCAGQLHSLFPQYAGFDPKRRNLTDASAVGQGKQEDNRLPQAAHRPTIIA